MCSFGAARGCSRSLTDVDALASSTSPGMLRGGERDCRASSRPGSCRDAASQMKITARDERQRLDEHRARAGPCVSGGDPPARSAPWLCVPEARALFTTVILVSRPPWLWPMTPSGAARIRAVRDRRPATTCCSASRSPHGGVRDRVSGVVEEEPELVALAIAGSFSSSLVISAQRAGLDAVPCTKTTGMRPGRYGCSITDWSVLLPKEVAAAEAGDLEVPDRRAFQLIGERGRPFRLQRDAELLTVVRVSPA